MLNSTLQEASEFQVEPKYQLDASLFSSLIFLIFYSLPKAKECKGMRDYKPPTIVL